MSDGLTAETGMEAIPLQYRSESSQVFLVFGLFHFLDRSFMTSLKASATVGIVIGISSNGVLMSSP